MTRIEDLWITTEERDPRWGDFIQKNPAPLDLRLALGDVVVCDTCSGSGRTPNKTNPGFTCVCHRGRGERECQAHRMWDACPDCRNGVRLNPDKVEGMAKRLNETEPDHYYNPSWEKADEAHKKMQRSWASELLWALIETPPQ